MKNTSIFFNEIDRSQDIRKSYVKAACGSILWNYFCHHIVPRTNPGSLGRKTKIVFQLRQFLFNKLSNPKNLFKCNIP